MVIRLWLDDLRPAPPGWLHARSVNEAIAIMAGPGQVTEVSLDHGLGDYAEDGGDRYRLDGRARHVAHRLTHGALRQSDRR